MGVTWTKEQEQVIRLRDRNILVSAAAGSGKTAVLVERILSMLTDPVHPLDVSRLLVVTFTKAAAAEMKERIRKAIETLLEEKGENPHLRQQATLIYSAQITTIDSFCQMVVREHFHRIDLDPGFRVADEGELKLLQQDVLDEMLEEEYVGGTDAFRRFVEAYAPGRNDRKLGEMILKLYTYSRSYPDPEEWLEKSVRLYKSCEADGAFPEELESKLMGLMDSSLGEAKELLQTARKICQTADGPYMYEETLEADLEIVQSFLSAATLAERFQCAAEIRQDGKIRWRGLSTKRDPDVAKEKREQVKQLREQVKKNLEEICGQYLYGSPEELAEDMQRCSEPAGVLTDLVRKFGMRFSEKKRDRNLIDFTDMEHFALRILAEKQDGSWIPTKAAEEYQKQYAEVLIDEYQDSNLLQEVILTSVSTVSCGKNNVFMVGDVKQSIYRFRLSCPELFMEKFYSYSLEDSDAQRIDLHKNFRSREEVLDSVNFVFRQIMRKELGGIDYDDRSALYPGADYQPVSDAEGVSVNRTELMLVDIDKEELSARETVENAKELEARAVAGEIKKILRTGRVLDSKTGLYRRPSYRDIVILTRSVKEWTDTFAEVLNKEGIPTYAGSSEGYFATYEVRVLLDYLKVVDNPRQDLPLTAVLTSPLCNLSAAYLTRIRNAFPDKRFFEAVALWFQQIDTEKETDNFIEKENKILYDEIKKIQYFRDKTSYTPIQELLWEILQKTGYYAMISAMPGGEQKKANLDMLLTKAAEFEKTSYKGLFHFIRYIEQLKKYDVDYGEANITDEQMDAVRFFSIHKSKGLEFPIVFVCGLGKQFNRQDERESVILHQELGIGMDVADLELHTKFPTILKRLMQKETLRENLGEELRVLYVAMTRAKERLILTGTMEKAEEKLGKYTVMETGEKERSSLGSLIRAAKYLDWILPVLLRHPDNSPINLRLLPLADIAETTAEEMETEAMAQDVLLNWAFGQTILPEWRAELEKQLEYRYPYDTEGQMKLKFTVSELKKRACPAEEAEEEIGEELIKEPEVIPLLPEFVQGKQPLDGASRGSAYHRLLELLDFSATYDEETLKKAVEGFRAAGKMSSQMAECIRSKDILQFLQSNLGKRMKTAAEKGQLKREQPFVLGVDAGEIYPEQKSEEMILVQGIIDVYFEEDGELVLLDYKTDWIFQKETFLEKYKAQLDYYEKALAQLLQKPVKEKWIYSFSMGRCIPV